MTQAPVFDSDPRQRDDGLWVFERREFAAQRFDYKAGEHVVFGGPTQRGKTTLAFVLLEYTATPELPAYVAVSKPNDPTTAREGARLGFRRVSEWPPTPTLKEAILREKPPGYLVWPRFGNMDTDVQNCARVTANLLGKTYTEGARNKKAILVMDDTMTKSKLMGLDRQMVTHLAMSGAMGVGMWVFVQKPTDSGRAAIWSYGASEHLFLTYDQDKMNQRRYSEIGGVDPKFIAEATRQLKAYQFLYIKRTEQFMCVVDAK